MGSPAVYIGLDGILYLQLPALKKLGPGPNNWFKTQPEEV